jgi:predicted nucleotide-binding protein
MKGRVIHPDRIEQVQIAVTDEPYEEIEAKVLADWENERKTSGSIYFGSPGWTDITSRGRDVTDEILIEVEETLNAEVDQESSANGRSNVRESWVGLLRAMVIAVRANPEKERRPFFLPRGLAGDSLRHPGFDGGRYPIYYGDFVTLMRLGYVHDLRDGTYDVTSEGFSFFDQGNKPDTMHTMRHNEQEKPPVFLVHGRDRRRHEVVLTVTRIWGSEPIVLEDSGGYGGTIIENFERETSEVAYAIVLLTGDDEGRLRGEMELKSRARQNVIFELGYFFGKLGRKRVAVLIESKIERPTDIDGLRYIALDDRNGWKIDLAKAMREAGLEVDLNRV